LQQAPYVILSQTAKDDKAAFNENFHLIQIKRMKARRRAAGQKKMADPKARHLEVG
jgi:hypothetical protein